jgi:hypothetical protein
MIIIGINVFFGKVLPSGEYRRSPLFISKDLVLELWFEHKRDCKLYYALWRLVARSSVKVFAFTKSYYILLQGQA